MNDAYILAILLILLEACHMWAEYRLNRRLDRVLTFFETPGPATVSTIKPETIPRPADPPQPDNSVIKMTADRDRRILEDEDDI